MKFKKKIVFKRLKVNCGNRKSRNICYLHEGQVKKVVEVVTFNN